MSTQSKFAKWTATVFATSLISIVLAYVLRLILARELAVEEYGLFYAVVSFVYLFGVLKDLGLGPSAAKHIAEYAALRKLGQVKYIVASVTAVQMALGVVVFAILFIGSGYFASSFFKNDAAAAIIVILAFEFLVGLSTLKPSLQGLQKVVAYSASEPLRLSIIIVLVLTVLPRTASGVAMGYLAAGIVATLWLSSNLVRYLYKYKMEKEDELFTKVFRFAFIVFASGIIGYVVSYTDVLALTYFRSLFEVGLYQAALPTSQVLWIFATAVGTVLLPFVSELWAKGKPTETANGTTILLRIAFATVIPFALIFISYPEIILRTLFGEPYAAGAIALQILAVGSIFFTMFSILGTILMGINKPGSYTKITVVVAIFNLASNIITIPVFGIAGAAFSTSASYLIGFLLASRTINKTIKISLPVVQLAKLFLGGLITLGVIAAMKGILVTEPITEAIITMVIGTVIYVLYAFLSNSVTTKDLQFLRSMGMPIPAKIIRLAERLS